MSEIAGRNALKNGEDDAEGKGGDAAASAPVFTSACSTSRPRVGDITKVRPAKPLVVAVMFHCCCAATLITCVVIFCNIWYALSFMTHTLYCAGSDDVYDMTIKSN